MGMFSISGLGSGIDTRSLINELIQAEARPKTRLEWRRQLWDVRRSTWSDLNTRMGSLKGAADRLGSITTWTSSGVTSASSANPAKVDVAITGPNPESGSFDVQVSQLAANARWESSPTPGLVAQNQTLFFQVGGATAQVGITAGRDVDWVANRINSNAAVSALVTASVEDGALVIRSNSEGAAGDLTMWSNRNNANNYLTTAGITKAQAGQDAQFTVNGASFSRSTNEITDLLDDVTLTLGGVSVNPVTVTVDGGGLSQQGIKDSILDFVDKYNAVIDFINTRSAEKRVPNASNLQEFLKGPMASDRGFSGIASDLRRWASDVVAGVGGSFTNLADIGISTGASTGVYDPSNTGGRLVVDMAKLDAALGSDMASVQALFSSNGATLAEEGIGRRFGTLVGQMRTGGRIDASMQGASRQMEQMQDAIDRLDFRLERRRAMYERQFAAMETLLGQLQSQSAWLDGQISSLMQSSPLQGGR